MHYPDNTTHILVSRSVQDAIPTVAGNHFDLLGILTQNWQLEKQHVI